MSSTPGTIGVEVVEALQGGPVAVLTIDFPPLNIGSHAMRQALLRAVVSLQRRADIVGAVMVGAGGNFVAGSDVREFDAPPEAPHLPDIIAEIERLPFPVVAAIRGAALGGGCELALGCDWRMAGPDAVMGLPEATLGLIPGAGGTVRLPRLVGAIEAIEIVSTGRRLNAEEAHRAGLVDAIAEGDVVAAAVDWAVTNKGKRLARTLPVPPVDRDALANAMSEVERRARGAEAPGAAARSVVRGLERDWDTALEMERADSLRLRLSEQSKALRYLFQAERRAGRPDAGVEPRQIGKVGVVGAGRMGSDIAFVLARNGFEVSLVEANNDVLTQAQSQMTRNAERLVARGEESSAEAVTDRIRPMAIEALGDCGLVIEAVPEDLEIKRSLFGRLGEIVAADAILATNTSYLDIDQIAEPISGPERVVGMHFFNPAAVLKLVEIVETDRTSPVVVASLLRLARGLGKLPIRTRVGEGFVGNRIFAAYRRVCEYLVEDGCMPEQIDRAMVDFGMAMGPFAVFDLAGLDIAWAMRKRLSATRPNHERYVTIPDSLCEQGRFGRNAGKGWYDHVDGKPVPSALVAALIRQVRAEKGAGEQAFSDEEIVSLLVAAMANEAAWVVHEGVCMQAADVDVALCNGFGFPRHRGGALYWASQQDPGRLEQLGRRLETMSGRPTAPNFPMVVQGR